MRPAITRTLISIGIDPTQGMPGIIRALATTPGGNPRRILGTSTKVEKGEAQGVLTSVLYLSPWKEAGISMCPWASKGCAAACLGHSTGHLSYSTNQRVRIAKTLWFHLDPASFIAQLEAEIALHQSRARLMGKRSAIRLNGSSDVMWERHVDMERFNSTTFYDYTKAPHATRASRPANYHLTFSLDERPGSMDRARTWLANGGNVAVVLASETSNRERAKQVAQAVVVNGWNGYPALDGDVSDVRFDDEPGHWVALYAKGPKALNDTTGFVQRIPLA